MLFLFLSLITTDYIKIDELLSTIDTIQLNDISFVYSSPSFLKRYSEMPWTHFLNNENAEMLDTIDVLIRNNNAGISVDYQYNVFEYKNFSTTKNLSLSGGLMVFGIGMGF